MAFSIPSGGLSERTKDLISSENALHQLEEEKNYACVSELFQVLDENPFPLTKELAAVVIRLVKPETLINTPVNKLETITKKMRHLGVFKLTYQQDNAPLNHFEAIHLGTVPTNIFLMSTNDHNRQILLDKSPEGKVEFISNIATKFSSESQQVLVKYLKTGKLKLHLDEKTPEEKIVLIENVALLGGSLNIEFFIEDLKKYLTDNEIIFIKDINTGCAYKYSNLAANHGLIMLGWAASFYLKELKEERSTPEYDRSVLDLFSTLIKESPPLLQHSPMIDVLFKELSLRSIASFQNPEEVYLKLRSYRVARLEVAIENFLCKTTTEEACVNYKLLLLFSKTFQYQYALLAMRDELSEKQMLEKIVNAIHENSLFQFFSEILDFSKKWEIEGGKASIEKFIVLHQLDDKSALQYQKLAQEFDLAALAYAAAYWLDPSAESLKEASHSLSVQYLFKVLSHDKASAKQVLLIRHLLDVLKIEDVKHFQEEASEKLPRLLTSLGVLKDEDLKSITSRTEKAIALASKAFCCQMILKSNSKGLLKATWNNTKYHEKSIKFVLDHILVKEASVQAFIDLKKQQVTNESHVEEFNEIIRDIAFLTEMWELKSLRAILENYLVEYELDEDIENVETFVMPTLEAKVKEKIGYLRPGAVHILLGSEEDLTACIHDPEGVKKITWKKTYPINAEDLQLLTSNSRIRSLSVDIPFPASVFESFDLFKHLRELEMSLKSLMELAELPTSTLKKLLDKGVSLNFSLNEFGNYRELIAYPENLRTFLTFIKTQGLENVKRKIKEFLTSADFILWNDDKALEKLLKRYCFRGFTFKLLRITREDLSLEEFKKICKHPKIIMLDLRECTLSKWANLEVLCTVRGLKKVQLTLDSLLQFTYPPIEVLKNLKLKGIQICVTAVDNYLITKETLIRKPYLLDLLALVDEETSPKFRIIVKSLKDIRRVQDLQVLQALETSSSFFPKRLSFNRFHFTGYECQMLSSAIESREVEFLNFRECSFSERVQDLSFLRVFQHLKEIRLSLQELLRLSPTAIETFESLKAQGVNINIPVGDFDLFDARIDPITLTRVMEFAEKAELEEIKKVLKANLVLESSSYSLNSLSYLSRFKEFKIKKISIYSIGKLEKLRNIPTVESIDLRCCTLKETNQLEPLLFIKNLKELSTPFKYFLLGEQMLEILKKIRKNGVNLKVKFDSDVFQDSLLTCALFKKIQEFIKELGLQDLQKSIAGCLDLDYFQIQDQTQFVELKNLSKFEGFQLNSLVVSFPGKPFLWNYWSTQRILSTTVLKDISKHFPAIKHLAICNIETGGRKIQELEDKYIEVIERLGDLETLDLSGLNKLPFFIGFLEKLRSIKKIILSKSCLPLNDIRNRTVNALIKKGVEIEYK